MTFQIKNDEDWEMYLYLREIEEEWETNRTKLKSSESFKVFPCAKQIIPKKIEEWEDIQHEFSATIKKALTKIQQEDCDDFTKWFCREWVKETDGQKLMVAERHIKRLKRLLWLSQNRKLPKNWITEEQKELALSVPIEEALDLTFRRSGRTLTALCPFHNEHTPSFTVYTDSNRYWCFGCGVGGDVIKLIQELHNLKFTEAVRYLIGQ